MNLVAQSDQKRVEDKPAVSQAAILLFKCHEADENLRDKIGAKEVFHHDEDWRRVCDDSCAIEISIYCNPHCIEANHSQAQVIEDEAFGDPLENSFFMIVVKDIVWWFDQSLSGFLLQLIWIIETTGAGGRELCFRFAFHF